MLWGPIGLAPVEISCGTASAEEVEEGFTELPSGLLLKELKTGAANSRAVHEGDRVRVHWSGYTIGYQAKRVENTSISDEPFVFTIGAGDAIPAFDEAVSGMSRGAIRRLIIPGLHMSKLGWSLDRNKRYAHQGPQPRSFDGQRALDFVLDNRTFDTSNRTILCDIKLLGTTSGE